MGWWKWITVTSFYLHSAVPLWSWRYSIAWTCVHFRKPVCVGIIHQPKCTVCELPLHTNFHMSAFNPAFVHVKYTVPPIWRRVITLTSITVNYITAPRICEQVGLKMSACVDSQTLPQLRHVGYPLTHYYRWLSQWCRQTKGSKNTIIEAPGRQLQKLLPFTRTHVKPFKRNLVANDAHFSKRHFVVYAS